MVQSDSATESWGRLLLALVPGQPTGLAALRGRPLGVALRGFHRSIQAGALKDGLRCVLVFQLSSDFPAAGLPHLTSWAPWRNVREQRCAYKI